MSANTSPDNIVYPVSTDQVAPLETVFAAQATSVQAALTNRFAKKQINNYKWANAAARVAQTGMAEGDIGDQADTDTIYRYDGTAWKNMRTGLISIVPASVAGGTLSPTGVITFTAAAALNINGCFTSEFDNYRILLEVDSRSATAGVVSRMRVGGVDSITSHSTQFTYSNGTTAAQGFSALAAANWNFDTGGQGQGDFEIEIRRPAIAVQTHGTFHSSNIGGSIYDIIGSFFHNVATAYDGISFIPSTGTITGRLRIYGYNNN